MFIVLPLKDGKRRILDTKNIISITESVNGGVAVQHRINRSLVCDVADTTIDKLAEALKAKYAWRSLDAEGFKNASPGHTGSWGL